MRRVSGPWSYNGVPSRWTHAKQKRANVTRWGTRTAVDYWECRLFVIIKLCCQVMPKSI